MSAEKWTRAFFGARARRNQSQNRIRTKSELVTDRGFPDDDAAEVFTKIIGYRSQ